MPGSRPRRNTVNERRSTRLASRETRQGRDRTRSRSPSSQPIHLQRVRSALSLRRNNTVEESRPRVRTARQGPARWNLFGRVLEHYRERQRYKSFIEYINRPKDPNRPKIKSHPWLSRPTPFSAGTVHTNTPTSPAKITTTLTGNVGVVPYIITCVADPRWYHGFTWILSPARDSSLPVMFWTPEEMSDALERGAIPLQDDMLAKWYTDTKALIKSIEESELQQQGVEGEDEGTAEDFIPTEPWPERLAVAPPLSTIASSLSGRESDDGQEHRLSWISIGSAGVLAADYAAEIGQHSLVRPDSGISRQGHRRSLAEVLELERHAAGTETAPASRPDRAGWRRIARTRSYGGRERTIAEGYETDR